MTTGEIIAEAGAVVSKELADQIQDAAVPYVWIQGEERNIKVLSSMAVNIRNYVDFSEEELKEMGVTELVYYPVLAKILEENEEADDEEISLILRAVEEENDSVLYDIVEDEEELRIISKYFEELLEDVELS